eukprot:TRINITY_DN23091_c0_g2_i1.p3 TRINITY_DN23091_c0_g2~~TRINITY_DN23091_c0_g2_i1.p3  ORF type:complete len:155 (+),score=12.72 TRINITY_DN23091_c0_g2_i1:151-615(+)
MIFLTTLLLALSTTVSSAVHSRARNVLGKSLKQCSTYPVTGYYRDGYCHTGPSDGGIHVVCSQVTKEFLEFTRTMGNDLITPFLPSFPGLKPGDKWCLCARRWKEAFDAGVAPNVIMEATHQNALKIVEMEQLQSKAVAKRIEDGQARDIFSFR